MKVVNIYQNGISLRPDEVYKFVYPLVSLKDTIKIVTDEKEMEIPMDNNKNYFIFKMNKGWTGFGKLVDKVTNGCYIAVVPSNWRRDKKYYVVHSTDDIQISGYRAHFFFVYPDQDKNILAQFVDLNNKPIIKNTD